MENPTGTQVFNEYLAQAIQNKPVDKLELNGMELDDLCRRSRVPTKLSYDCYIKTNNTYFKPKTPTNNPAEESTYADSKPNYTDGKTMKITTSDAMQLHSENPLERVWLRIVDTPGYGDNLDATRDFRQIRDFINAQYKSRYAADTAKDANNNLRKSDNLITCCLYFIAPHRLKENDIAFMKEISKMVIPFHPTFHRF